jgi:hypothetical protein
MAVCIKSRALSDFRAGLVRLHNPKVNIPGICNLLFNNKMLLNRIINPDCIKFRIRPALWPSLKSGKARTQKNYLISSTFKTPGISQ